MLRLLVRATVLPVLLTTLAPAVHAQTGTIPTARSVLAAMGAEKAFLQGLEAAIPAQQQAAPQLPAVFWDRLLTRAKDAAPAFLDSLAPVYAKELTEPELKQLLAFYQSPVGRKLAELQPRLLTNTQELGYRWGVRLGADVAKELTDEGVRLQ